MLYSQVTCKFYSVREKVVVNANGKEHALAEDAFENISIGKQAFLCFFLISDVYRMILVEHEGLYGRIWFWFFVYFVETEPGVGRVALNVRRYCAWSEIKNMAWPTEICQWDKTKSAVTATAMPARYVFVLVSI